MNWVLAVLAVAAGLYVGLIVNVVATRLAASRPLLGPLHCTRAPHSLKPLQSIPVLGYVLQRGCCSTCSQRLSPAYPATEAAMGGLFGALYLLEGFGPAFIFHAGYVAILMLVLVLDWKHRDIYISVIAVGCLLALAGSFVLPGMDIWSALIGAGVAGGFFMAAYVVARLMFRHIEEPLGSGDVLLALMMGLMLGFPNIVAALVAGPLLAGFIAIVLLITRKSNMGDFMPYGVSLCVAAILLLVQPGPLAEALHLSSLMVVLSNLFRNPF